MTFQLTWTRCKASKQSAAAGTGGTAQLVQTVGAEVTWSSGGSCMKKSVVRKLQQRSDRRWECFM